MADLIPKNWRIDPRSETHVIADNRSICSVSYRDTMDVEGTIRANKAIAELIVKAPALQALNAELVAVLKSLHAQQDKLMLSESARLAAMGQDETPENRRALESWVISIVSAFAIIQKAESQ